jgi:hypothetical protein
VIKAKIKVIANLDLAAIRAGIESHKRQEPPASETVDGKLLILNRYLFALPDLVDRDSPHFVHFASSLGWMGLPVTDEPGHPRITDPPHCDGHGPSTRTGNGI